MNDINISLKLIRILADGKFHSSKQLSETFKMSSTAIDKYILMVYSWGVDVFTIPNKGYRLCTPLQLLDESIIFDRLQTKRLTVLSIINSTNQYLVERIGTLQSGDACVAEYQTQGRGRRGQQWISSFGNNIYLSLYWCLNQGSTAAIGLSLMVCIVIAEVLQHLGAKGVRVKWPNDIYLNNRKLAGILVETFSRSSDISHIVIGAGINLAMRQSTVGIINQNWINLQETNIIIDRNLQVAKLILKLRQALKQFEYDGFTPFITRWHALDNFFNQPIKLLINKQEIIGIERGIDTHGALLLEQEKGEIYSYFGGEISLRDRNINV